MARVILLLSVILLAIVGVWAVVNGTDVTAEERPQQVTACINGVCS